MDEMFLMTGLFFLMAIVLLALAIPDMAFVLAIICLCFAVGLAYIENKYK